MIMGAAIASVAWIGFYPRAKLEKLKASLTPVVIDGGWVDA